MIPFTMTRARAVLAGGAALGLGAVGTLAYWSDSEFSTGLFHAVPNFEVQGSTSGSGPFETHSAVSSSAPLSFSLPTGELALNQPIEATYWLRMAHGTTGSVSVKAPTVERADLSDRIEISVDQRECGVGGGAQLQSGRLGALTDVADAFTLPAGVDGAAGAAVPVCITATLADVSGLEPGHAFSTGKVDWTFTVTESEA